MRLKNFLNQIVGSQLFGLQSSMLFEPFVAPGFIRLKVSLDILYGHSRNHNGAPTGEPTANYQAESITFRSSSIAYALRGHLGWHGTR